MKEKQQSKKVSSKTTTKRDPEDIGVFGEVEKKQPTPEGHLTGEGGRASPQQCSQQ